MRFFVAATVAVFLATFNLGYVFHELVMGAWFQEQEHLIAREKFIIPAIALAFLVYSAILAHLFPIYRRHFGRRSTIPLALQFGLLMGVLFDALQGGLIEYATFRMPFQAFLVDSAYHVLVEGTVAGLVLALVYQRVVERRPAAVRRAS